MSDSYRRKLESLVAQLGLKDHVKFFGFLPDAVAEARMRSWRVGVAPYNGAFSNLDSGKVNFYAWCGVPSVVSTMTPPMAELVTRFGAGLPSDGFVEETVRLLRDDESYSGCQKGCRALAEDHDAVRYFDRLFSEI